MTKSMNIKAALKALDVKPHRYSLRNPSKNAPARIAIVIDDMGMNKKYSKAMANSDSVPMTLA